MIAYRPLRPICVALALEYRWARPSEGRPEYTFVAYDPKKRDIVGEVSFSAIVDIDEVQMSEEWRNRGAFTELLRQMLKNIQRDKFKIKQVIHKTSNEDFPAGFIDLYQEAGFYTDGDEDFTRARCDFEDTAV
ncbi:hypothetical protein FOZ60_015420 [Perkinsus olseni]|uniref:N-acetyltransferase domain-containing protein n=2 Tax=Perkinsus olseni TaxID=32597 RepID=A0A7J6N6J7_PEROL|nr:hypothetical protein FOZ60_015420 [Perkinsus olseni]